VLIGRSRAIVRLRAELRLVAESDARVVLLCGETGTGKEVVARTLHASGPRRARPFVPVNCSAVPLALLEDAFFGHESGAFTGARERRAGLVESAAGGTLLLDEVGELDPGAQAKLLRLLESGGVRRLGGTEERVVDVAATNRDLAAAARAGGFRRDLYYRLNTVQLDLPPLRERREDVALLAEHFLRELAARSRKPFTGFTAEALRRLEAYAWPGNVRELRGAIERAVLLHAGPQVTADLLELDDGPGAERDAPTPPPLSRADDRSRADDLRFDAAERRTLARALESALGNQTQAARLLGVSRDTVRALMHKHGARLELRVTFEPDGAHGLPEGRRAAPVPPQVHGPGEPQGG
jgi:DNA-binding NtrC family response regulator